jgi:hypothetical protein
MNGCICCTVRGDLVEALKRLYKRVDKFGKLFCVVDDPDPEEEPSSVMAHDGVSSLDLWHRTSDAGQTHIHPY